MRLTSAWVMAKEENGRKIGRVAVTAEGNVELRTQLARHAGRHAQFSPEEATFVLETLSDHFLFRSLSKEQQTRMLTHFERRALKQGETLVKQGEEGAREFFVVVAGSLEVSVLKTGESKPTTVATVRARCPPAPHSVRLRAPAARPIVHARAPRACAMSEDVRGMGQLSKR